MNNSNDLISRVAAIEAVLSEERYCEHRGVDDETLAAVQMVKFKVEKIPTIDAIPVGWLIDRANDPERAPLYRRYAQMLYEEWWKEQEVQDG